MKALSKVKYTEDGMAYQCVELTEDEIRRSIPLKDISPDVEITIIPFRPLPFPPTGAANGTKRGRA
jgi:hypothetical protein